MRADVVVREGGARASVLGLAFALALFGGCSRATETAHAADEPAISQPAAVSLPASAPAPSSPPNRRTAKSPAQLRASPAPVQDDLKAEEKEINPYSETVSLKLAVTPPLKAQVLWGAKQLAKLSPGQMEAEIVRPRGSGPLDLEIRADGYLPYHTRLYADRNDKVSVRLCRAEDAPGLFGYKRAAAPAAGPTEKKQ